MKTFFTSTCSGLKKDDLFAEEDLKDVMSGFDDTYFNYGKAQPEEKITIYGRQFIYDFKKVFDTLDRLKEDRGSRDLFDWTDDKGEGYDPNMPREMRELCYIAED